MAESLFVARRTLAQINATIIAGMLIFLTINDSIPVSPVNFIVIFSIILGFALMIISIGLCIKTTEDISSGSDERLIKPFKRAVNFFFAGILVLFIGASLIILTNFQIV